MSDTATISSRGVLSAPARIVVADDHADTL